MYASTGVFQSDLKPPDILFHPDPPHNVSRTRTSSSQDPLLSRRSSVKTVLLSRHQLTDIGPYFRLTWSFRVLLGDGSTCVLHQPVRSPRLGDLNQCILNNSRSVHVYACVGVIHIYSLRYMVPNQLGSGTLVVLRRRPGVLIRVT